MKAWLENALTNSQVEYLSQVVADEQTEILEALQEFVDKECCLVLTTGGTGRSRCHTGGDHRFLRQNS